MGWEQIQPEKNGCTSYVWRQESNEDGLSPPSPQVLPQKDIGWSQLMAKDGIIEQRGGIFMDKDDQDMMDFLNDEIDSLKEKLTAAAERERVLVEALEFYVEDDECKYGPSEGGTHPYCEDDEACRWCKANQALAQVKGGG